MKDETGSNLAPLDWSAWTDDPEIAALLDFDPVVRRTNRHDGWTDDHQRRFILGLAILGNVNKAANALGRTLSGAWKVRTAAGAESFARAWDEALALHERRKPPRPYSPPPPSRQPRSPAARAALQSRTAPAARAEEEVDPAEMARVFTEILANYGRKLAAERKARLAGRIVEADFYVRQLTFIELVLEAGGHAQEVLAPLKIGRLPVLSVVATPCSNLLERLRRAIWEEKGEADRPPPPPLGSHDAFAAMGEGGRTWRGPMDGDPADWQRREAEKAAQRAEAQAAWEERARADAESWAAREAETPSPSRGVSGEDCPRQSSDRAGRDRPGTGRGEGIRPQSENPDDPSAADSETP